MIKENEKVPLYTDVEDESIREILQEFINYFNDKRYVYNTIMRIFLKGFKESINEEMIFTEELFSIQYKFFNDLGKVINGEYTIGETVDNASTSVGTIMECVNKTITNIRAIKNDAIIVIASPTPWASYHPGGGANKDIAEKYVKAVRTVAHNQCCIFLDLFHESNVWSWNNAWNNVYCTDGVHPNDLGHKRYLYPIIRDTLNKVNPNK